MNVSDNQRLNATDIEADRSKFGTRRSVSTLFQTTVDQQAGGAIEVQLVAGTGYAPGTTMMRKGGKFHTAARSPRPKNEVRITSFQRERGKVNFPIAA